MRLRKTSGRREVRLQQKEQRKRRRKNQGKPRKVTELLHLARARDAFGMYCTSKYIIKVMFYGGPHAHSSEIVMKSLVDMHYEYH